MTFRALPARLQAFILLHVPAVALCLWALTGVATLQRPDLLLILAGCTALSSVLKVELTVLQARMTPAFAIVCLALHLCGPLGAMVCSLVGAVAGSYFKPVGPFRVKLLTPPFHRVAVNSANAAVSSGLGGAAYWLIQGSVASHEAALILSTLSYTATYFAVNTIGIAVTIGLAQDKPILNLWRENFMWTAPGFFASASIAIAAYLGYAKFQLWSLMILPAVYLVYSSYKLYMDRLTLYSRQMEKDLLHIRELNDLNQSVIASLAAAIDAKDSYTCSHINRVRIFALSLAKALNLDEMNTRAVATAALVHDIGKLGIPDNILGKPGKLTAEEYERIKSHVEIGVEILSPIPFPFPVVPVVGAHHERWDGLGYPKGLAGEDIPVGARIISIVDVYDALTSDRPYRKALTQEQALDVLFESAGKQFDPHLLEVFREILPAALEEISQAETSTNSDGETAPATAENSFAFAQIARAAAEMAAVCDVAQALADLDSHEQVSQVVAERALALSPADAAVLYLLDEEGTSLRAVGASGLYSDRLEGMTIAPGEGVAGLVFRDGTPRLNVSASFDVARRFTPEENLELSATSAVPVLCGHQCVGVLSVYTRAYSVIGERHMAVLSILAEHAASGVQNARRVHMHQELASTDPLTGLANSRALFQHLERVTHHPKSDPQPFGLIMLDLDEFKRVNDQYGHMRGDELLIEVAERLRRACRATDMLCRYAGDEFVVVQEGADEARLNQTCLRIREELASISLEDGAITARASAGFAVFPVDGTEARELLNHADQRMYQDKFARKCPPPTPVIKSLDPLPSSEFKPGARRLAEVGS